MENRRITKEEAIRNHRAMWIWIAREIARRKRTVSIVRYKEKYITEVMGLREDDVYLECFCCEYAANKRKFLEGSSGNMCKYCPVEWQSEASAFMCEHKNETDFKARIKKGLWIRCEIMNTRGRGDWKKQAKLAYKIAMLPEREDV